MHGIDQLAETLLFTNEKLRSSENPFVQHYTGLNSRLLLCPLLTVHQQNPLSVWGGILLGKTSSELEAWGFPHPRLGLGVYGKQQLPHLLNGHTQAQERFLVLLSCKVLDEIVPTFLSVMLLNGEAKVLELYQSQSLASMQEGRKSEYGIFFVQLFFRVLRDYILTIFFFSIWLFPPPWQKIKNKKKYLSYSQSEAPVTHLMALVVELWRARHSADFGGNAETWSDVLAHKESTVLATEWVCKHYATSVWVLSDVKIAKNGSMEVETMLLPWTEVFANEVAFELHLKEWMGVWWLQNWGKYLIFGEQDSWECLED